MDTKTPLSLINKDAVIEIDEVKKYLYPTREVRYIGYKVELQCGGCVIEMKEEVYDADLALVPDPEVMVEGMKKVLWNNFNARLCDLIVKGWDAEKFAHNMRKQR